METISDPQELIDYRLKNGLCTSCGVSIDGIDSAAYYDKPVLEGGKIYKKECRVCVERESNKKMLEEQERQYKIVHRIEKSLNFVYEHLDSRPDECRKALEATMELLALEYGFFNKDEPRKEIT